MAVETPPPRAIPGLSSARGLLFDMDGTMCDTDPIHMEVFSELLLAHGKCGGVRIDDAFFREKIAGRTNEDIFGDLFPELTVPERETLWEKKEEDFRALARSKLERLPGLTELLDAATAARVPFVAVTNAPRPNAELMLDALGLAEAFAGRLVIGVECERAKPNPDPYLKGLDVLGVPRADAAMCVAFEDSPTGCRAAVAAGVPTVGLLTAQPREALEKEGASLCVENFADAKLAKRLIDA